ncbi:hypothetical protein VaNZ11_015900 [Volvox africanus]|uniref:Uncharacterized protein n=1 Tax=Volvox africanus TaxID=51714 RepID=A0ABQ5SNA5_9CHLO|nr:hypothetical protein VaNZ11_015900 [Volvox africanus]
MVSVASKFNLQAVIAFAWALAAGLPLLFRHCFPDGVVRIWALTTAALPLFSYLGVFVKSKGCVHQIKRDSVADSAPATDDCTTKRQGNVTPHGRACYLVANASPGSTSPTAPAHGAPRTGAVDSIYIGPHSVASPPCTLSAAAAHSAETSRAGSACDSGQLTSAPQTLVESVRSIANLRRNYMRYRSPYASSARVNTATGISDGDGAGVDRIRFQIKIPHMDPRDLRPDLVFVVGESLRAYDSGLQLVGAYARRGCVELTLDLLDCGAALGRVGVSSGCGDSARDEIEIAALVLSALRVRPQAAPAVAPLAVADSGQQQQRDDDDILVQRVGACWSMGWNADAQRWQARSTDSTMATRNCADGMVLAMSAPVAVHAVTQLAPGAAATGCGALRVVVDLRMETRVDADIDPTLLTVIAKANGRTVTAQVLSGSWRSIGATDVTLAPPLLPPLTPSVVELELDLARLAAGRSEASPGLVVRLELWYGARILDITSLACLVDECAVSELLAVQRDLAAASRLDAEDEAYTSPEQQVMEMQQLLGDLCVWLDFAAMCPTPAVVGLSEMASLAPAPPAAQLSPQDPLDISSQVAALLRSPALQQPMLEAGRHLLQYFVCQGHTALARAVYTDLAPRAAAAGMSLDKYGEHLPLLHRAVRSDRREMVEMVLTWLCGPDSATAPGVAVWGVCNRSGITPLHLLAVDARCGGATKAAMHDSPDRMATSMEFIALLRWILATWPAAVTVWNTARDVRGNTPAMLWAALGGQDVQVQTAAAVLAVQVPNAAACASEFSFNADNDVAPNAGHLSGGTIAFEPVHVSAKTPCTATGSSAHCQRAPKAKAAAADVEHLLPSGSARPPRMTELLQLSLRGFPQRSVEREYVDYVTHSTAPSTLIWLVIMVLTHYTAFNKSPNMEEGRQALVGGSAYLVSLSLMVLAPRVYTKSRESLMLTCMLGRTLCRLLMTVLPDLLHMSDAVQKYIRYGVDVLLDGFMEGTFERTRVPQAFTARLLLEWPIMAAFFQVLGVRNTYGAALLRAAAVSGAGAFMSAVTDMRARAMFLRERQAQISVIAAEKEKTQ